MTENYAKNSIGSGLQIIGDLLWLTGFHVEASIRWFGALSARWVMAYKQRLVLAVGTILVIAAGVFPPWNFVATPRPGWVIKKSAGYSSLFSPPRIQLVKKNPGTSFEYEDELTTDQEPKYVSVELNWNPLLAEWTTILLATGGLFLFFGTAKTKSK